MMPTFLDDRVVLVTGATGSFGRAFVETALRNTRVARVVVFSRDEFKQHELRNAFPSVDRLRFVLGDVRDRDRVRRAFAGVDFVVHAAALKQIPIGEHNPFEFVKTNVLGAQNVIDAALDCGVSRVVALSTDKAVSPASLYGATKLIADKLFVAGNIDAVRKRTRFAVVRLGNFLDSRGSVFATFRRAARTGRVPITHPEMTRFWMTIDQSVELVLTAIETMSGGEIFVPKIPSMKILDLAQALAPNAELDVIGIRPGERLHEELVSASESRSALDCGGHFVILPDLDAPQTHDRVGEPVSPGFRYASETNDDRLDAARLKQLLSN